MRSVNDKAELYSCSKHFLNRRWSRSSAMFNVFFMKFCIFKAIYITVYYNCNFFTWDKISCPLLVAWLNSARLAAAWAAAWAAVCCCCCCWPQSTNPSYIMTKVKSLALWSYKAKSEKMLTLWNWNLQPLTFLTLLGLIPKNVLLASSQTLSIFLSFWRWKC